MSRSGLDWLIIILTIIGIILLITGVIILFNGVIVSGIITGIIGLGCFYLITIL